MSNQTFLFVTNSDKNPQTVKAERNSLWSCSRKTAKGNRALVYVNGDGIAYEWVAVTDNKRSPEGWNWPFCCKVKLVRSFNPPIRLSELRNEIPKKDWNAPHCNMHVKPSTIIKEEVAEKVRALRKSLADAPMLSANDVPDGLPVKVKLTVNCFIRDTKSSRQIKGLYKNRCQVCGRRLEIQPGVFYAEGHHLQPLGGEHKGPDVQDNILCLCPNHHALFDYFAVALDPSKLRLKKHDLRQSFVDYHNAQFCLRTGGTAGRNGL